MSEMAKLAKKVFEKEKADGRKYPNLLGKLEIENIFKKKLSSEEWINFHREYLLITTGVPDYSNYQVLKSGQSHKVI
jgi:hypothetical protein